MIRTFFTKNFHSIDTKNADISQLFALSLTLHRGCQATPLTLGYSYRRPKEKYYNCSNSLSNIL